MALTCPIDFDVASLRAEVQAMYARVATSPTGDFHFHRGPAYAATMLGYDSKALAALPPDVTASFAGVGNPHAIHPLETGAVVLDVGCGAGTDLLVAARRVGPRGRAIGIDMTEGMRARAAAGAAACGLTNVDVRAGDATRLPVDDGSVDVVISNGVLNLVPEKQRALAEIARVLRPGGRVQIADIVIGEELPESALRDIDRWTGWIAGALPEAELVDAFTAAGFSDARIVARFDCFAGTSKERTARRYGVGGVNLSAVRAQALHTG